MSKSFLLCVLAMAFYGLEISVADWKLTRISPRLLTFCYALGVAVLAGIGLLFHWPETIPCGKEWAFVGMMIVASFVAALAHFAALHEGAGAVSLTLVYCLLPVVASLFAAVFNGELPTVRLVLAWAAAAVALALISGNRPAV
jgi:drug/metabolite transporter (DMT)-like permease